MRQKFLPPATSFLRIAVCLKLRGAIVMGASKSNETLLVQLIRLLLGLAARVAPAKVCIRAARTEADYQIGTYVVEWPLAYIQLDLVVYDGVYT